MSMTYNTGTANAIVTGNVTATVTETTRALTVVRRTSTGSETVPANKIWKVIYLRLAAGANYWQLNGVYVLESETSLPALVVFAYSDCPVLTAGQSATFTRGAGTAEIGYIEESV